MNIRKVIQVICINQKSIQPNDPFNRWLYEELMQHARMRIYFRVICAGRTCTLFLLQRIGGRSCTEFLTFAARCQASITTMTSVCNFSETKIGRGGLLIWVWRKLELWTQLDISDLFEFKLEARCLRDLLRSSASLDPVVES